MAEYIAKITIRHNGTKYNPGDPIDLSKKEAGRLPVCSKDEWGGKQNPGDATTKGAASDGIRSLQKEIDRLKKELEAIKKERTSLKGELTKAKNEVEALKKDAQKEGGDQ